MEPEAKVKKKNKKNTGILIIGTVFVAIIIILLIFLMQGKTTTSGNYPENVSSHSMTCVVNNVEYPFFTYDKSDSQSTTINMIFSNNKIKNISLIHVMNYSSEEMITGSEAFNHAAMNKSFGSALGPDALGARYSKLDNAMKMSLFADNSEITDISAKYFLIDLDNANSRGMDDYKKNYESKKFDCQIINNK